MVLRPVDEAVGSATRRRRRVDVLRWSHHQLMQEPSVVKRMSGSFLKVFEKMQTRKFSKVNYRIAPPGYCAKPSFFKPLSIVQNDLS